MKSKSFWLFLAGLAGSLAITPLAWAQRRPYIGYAYPAGGQQGTTFQVKLGAQDVDDVEKVLVTGVGVTARVVEYYRRLNPQEMRLLDEQLRDLKRTKSAGAPAAAAKSDGDMMMAAMAADLLPGGTEGKYSSDQLAARIQKRRSEYVQQPACASIASIVVAEITIAANAEPGARELRLATPRGVSNPLVFHVGQFPEYARPAMLTSPKQILGKEVLALRKRAANEVEDRIALPCTVNGQIASGEVNRYRFKATRGQRLVVTTAARQLVPFVADAVPGWFQPVIALYDAQGRERAFADDYRFMPDPVILYQVPEDGEYVLEIHDSIYRGREDFVYRMTVGELPFVTSIFPLGGQGGTVLSTAMEGWNLDGFAQVSIPPKIQPGLHLLAASRGNRRTNAVPFVVDTLPDVAEQEPNNAIAAAQPIELPAIINGRIDRADDWDVFQITGKANETIVAEVQARWLESPLDSAIKLTTADGRLLAFNDDHEDLTAGVNTHHADSYLLAKLPADGTYYLHIGDTARAGGKEYGYRLRVSAPRPDFKLRAVPSSVNMATNGTGVVTVYALRKDGFNGPIRLALKDPPPGITAAPVVINGNQTVGRLTVRGGQAAAGKIVNLSIVGGARIGDREVFHEAVPAEDRMQAFLWRHLVPAKDLAVMVYDRNYQPTPRRPAPTVLPTPVVAAAPAVSPAAVPATAATVAAAKAPDATTATAPVATTTNGPDKPKFTKQQIAGRLRQLKLLYEEGLLTDGFYSEKVAECVQ